MSGTYELLMNKLLELYAKKIDELESRIKTLEEIIKHPIYVYNPNKETPKCRTCDDTRIVPAYPVEGGYSTFCKDCAPKTICEHEWIEGYHFEECLKCKGIRGIEPKSKKCNDHIYDTVENECELCNSIIPIDSECVVTSYGGFKDPTFKVSCMKCVNRSNRKAGL